MHILPFTIKRAHLATTRLLGKIAARHDLTPARFDLLYLLHFTRYRCPFQHFLAERLGYSRSTICKMIRALRAAGLVDLRRDRCDGRYRRIALTRYGRKCFSKLLRDARRGRIVAALRSAYATLGASRAEVMHLLRRIVARLERFWRGIGSFYELYYFYSDTGILRSR